jgi:hypothetical protein
MHFEYYPPFRGAEGQKNRKRTGAGGKKLEKKGGRSKKIPRTSAVKKNVSDKNLLIKDDLRNHVELLKILFQIIKTLTDSFGFYPFNSCDTIFAEDCISSIRAAYFFKNRVSSQ